MNTFNIPSIGTVFCLTEDYDFMLYKEYRNQTMMKVYGMEYNWRDQNNNVTLQTLPSGLCLKVKRIYLKTASEFNSLTFTVVKNKTKADRLKYPMNEKFKGCTFWMKLADVNRMKIERLTKNTKTSSDVLEVIDYIRQTAGLDSSSIQSSFSGILPSGDNLSNINTDKDTITYLTNMLDKFVDKNTYRSTSHLTKIIECLRYKIRSYKLDMINEMLETSN